MANQEAGWQLSNPLYFLTKEIELMCIQAEQKALGGRPEFDRAGVRPGLQIWRIEMARAKPWPVEKYGRFHRGDSYIVLNSYPGENGYKIYYDVHFWIGAESSEDEYGAAAFKTAGLDTKLWKARKRGNTHREVMEFESELFLSYFKDRGGIEYLEGGIEGLADKPVVDTEEEEEEEEDRVILDKLFRVKGRAGMIMMTQVPCNYGSLNTGDVFLLDTDEAVYQWNGRGSNEDERERANRFAKNKALERNDLDGQPRLVIEMIQDETDGEERTEFWDRLPKRIKGPLGQDVDLEIQDAEEDDDNLEVIPKLFKLKSKIHQFSTGPYEQISQDGVVPFLYQLKSTEIYVLNTGFEYITWIGKDADPEFCKLEHSFKVFPLTLLYIKRYRQPAMLPLHMYKEGYEPPTFFDHFDRREYVPTRWDAFFESLNSIYERIFPPKKRIIQVEEEASVQNEESDFRARARSWLRSNTQFWVKDDIKIPEGLHDYDDSSEPSRAPSMTSRV